MAKKETDPGFVLPYDLVDQIALASLKDHRKYLKTELKQWKKNPKTEVNPTGKWLHPEDVGRYELLIHSMDELIDFYGG
jgi:hypothetical protein